MTDTVTTKIDKRSVAQSSLGKIMNTLGIYGIALLFLILGAVLQAFGVINNFLTGTNMLNIVDAVSMLGIVAVAVMGKPGYAYIKSRVFGFLRQYGPPAEVSRTRYRFGLVMFAVPILFGWIAPYAADLIPGYAEHAFTYAIAGDLLLLASLFVLGGDFWDKLRALFFHEAKAVFHQPAG